MSKTFDIYERAPNIRTAVKQGFSWPAFFFIFFWAFYKKLWSFGLVVLAIFVVLVFVEQNIEYLNFPGLGFLFTIIHLTVAIVVGSVGNDKLKSLLLSLGYNYSSSVEANSIDDVFSNQ